jgi:signal transduction histidine kinase
LRGIFARILAWFLAILLASVAALMVSSLFFDPRWKQGRGGMRGTADFELSEAVHAYESGGRAGLSAFFERMERSLGGRHFLLDATGRDLVTGRARPDLLRGGAEPRPPLPWPFPFRTPHVLQFERASADGRYVYAVQVPVESDPARDLAVFGWIILVIVVLVYVMAVTLARPIRRLREVVLRFGKGELHARANLKRKDEIGDLALAFDEMAQRIEMLLTAERRLLADVSHELRSPLARLSFAVELLRKNPQSDEAYAKVKKEIDRISRMIGDLLQVTRVEGDPAAREEEWIEIGGLLREIVDDCALEAAPRGCEIKLPDEAACELHGDRELIRRAVENVLRNAIRFSPEGGSIEVEVAKEEHAFRVSVRDYGPGVPEEELAGIFRPFHRVEQDRGRAGGGGVGLGLAIARRAVLLHHGEIEAKNAHPGLLVEIYLPA